MTHDDVCATALDTFRFAPGFQAAGGRCGLKESGRLDLALLVAQQECSAAGVFTTNVIKAAPVRYDQHVLAEHGHHIRALVANSGCANACTGEQGEQATQTMATATADLVGCEPNQVLVLSTGVIGKQLDTQKISTGVQQLASQLSSEQAPLVAQAIMTTDTRPKVASMTITIHNTCVTIAGVAKGSGMIHPTMATMLAVITTDIQASPLLLHQALEAANLATFNCVTVDGDPSTNDTALLLASGVAAASLDSATLAVFTQALIAVCRELARQIAADGEGASKLVTIQVSGAPTIAAARQIARTVARSPLVKTAIHGGDPNWGRILAAAGMAGVPFDPATISLKLGAIEVVCNSVPANYSEQAAAAAMVGPEVVITLDLAQGSASAEAWTCDLSADYVRINADYRT